MSESAGKDRKVAIATISQEVLIHATILKEFP
jgi:hypothetical protein